jgi:MFS family permease
VLAAQGAGAVVGGVTMLRARFKRPLVASALSLLIWPFPLLSLAYLAPLPVIAIGAFLGGAGFAVFDTQWQTTMQREVPTELLSRVSAYDWFGSLVFLPIGYAIAGPVVAVVGIHEVFIFGSAYLLVSVAGILLIPSVRHMSARTEGRR